MKKGFTLAELLIALAILGVIATFSIPKVLQSQQDSKWKSMGKEAISTVSGAYEAYKLKNTATASTNSLSLTPYINYVRVDTSSYMDDPDSGSWDCSAAEPCLFLHNGGVLHYTPTMSFAGTATTNALFFAFDQDGKATGDPSLAIFLYYDGRITTSSGVFPNTVNSNWTQAAPYTDPTWFNWN